MIVTCGLLKTIVFFLDHFRKFGVPCKRNSLLTTLFGSPEITLEAKKKKIVWLKPVNNQKYTSDIGVFFWYVDYYRVHVIDAYKWILQVTVYGCKISSGVLISFYPNKSLWFHVELLQILIFLLGDGHLLIE